MTLWVIGGRDPTGGAGIDRDRATARAIAPQLAVAVVVTADTQQGDGRPARAQPRPSAALARELALLPRATAVKLGLVPDASVAAVEAAVEELTCPIVLDPILHASDGGALGSSVAGLVRLARRAAIVTPNRSDAAALVGDATLADDALLARLVETLAPAAVLLKDGHGRDPHEVCDRLAVGGRVHEFRRPRRPGPDPRGTGCALATAIACELERGLALVEACARAIAWLDEARMHTIAGPDGRPHLAPHRGA